MIRPAVRDDAARLMTCWNDAMPFDRLTFELLHEKLWADPDLSEQDVLVDERDGDIAGFGVPVCRPDQEFGVIKMYTVSRSFRRCGLGSALLEAMEERVRRSGRTRVRLGESPPNYLVPGLDVRYEEAGEFFRRRGYRSIGRTVNLQVDLAFLDPPDMSDHDVHYGVYHVRRATEEDQDGIMELLRAHWNAWLPEVSTALSNIPVTVHVAVCGLGSERPGQVVAFSASEANNKGTGWFGPMGTDPDHRGKGLGRILLRRCLEDLRRTGQITATIPWVGPVGFYHKAVGAQISRVFERMEKSLG